MNIVIFAGGSGTRFWPISRTKYPKQFQPIIDNKSTIELMAEAVAPEVGWNHLFIQTTENLVSLVKNTFPELPTSNILTEPARRDIGPAVGLAMAKLRKLGAGNEPVTILWSDNYPANRPNFLKVLRVGRKLVEENPSQLVFLGEKPHFANDNLGWQEVGEKLGEEDGINYYQLKSFAYKPDLETAKIWEKDGKHFWNTGYFITTPEFILNKVKELNPDVSTKLQTIEESMDTSKEADVLQEVYPQIETIHFDHLVLYHLKPEETTVIEGEYEWSDPGTLYALKQFLQEKESDNVCKGLVYNFETKDSLVYNYVNKQLVTTIGLDGFIVVNTPDAVLVCHKKDIKKISDMLKEFKDTELEKLL
jgi:mannose-1-phosphate guanylyltransferase